MELLSTDSTLLEPRLPPELERAIFEIAAFDWPTTIPTLALIAWRVKNWVEPLLYRTLWLATGPRLPRAGQRRGFPVVPAPILLKAITNKPPAFLASAVKSLFISHIGDIDPSTIEYFLTACTGVTNLCTRRPLEPHLRALGDMTRLHRLAVDVTNLFSSHATDFTHPLFRNLTHLELLDFPARPDASDALCAGLSLIPNLTHVAFSGALLCYTLEPSSMQPLLNTTCTQLQCIVCLSPYAYLDNADEMEGVRPLSTDDRFVYIGRTDMGWPRGVQTGEDYWELAEAFIAAKRAGKVDRSRYHVTDTDMSWRVV
ncbi:hypothetical protein B0H19DRAFT_186779 [Mycena capillaripes]|nr:hypothetical protein B0H19DRAFT_186779 [Mycena capillaripes]